MKILVADDEFCTLGLALRRLHRVNKLGHSLQILVQQLHQLRNVDRIHHVQSRANFCQVIEELEGRDLCVEGVWVLELLVPRLVHHRRNEGSTGIVGRF